MFTVFYMRHYVAYQKSAAEILTLCYEVCDGYVAKDVYDAIDQLSMMEYFSCNCWMLKHYQDEQIPLRFE